MKYSQIQPYIEKKLVSEQEHPDFPYLHIFNYTQSCQFEGAWDEVTAQCRGLIMDMRDETLVALPFPKFFNYQEHIQKGGKISDETPVITEKLDGSLGVLYWVGDNPFIATRGSFASDQAKWANQKLTEYDLSTFPRTLRNKVCFLFEIIYPENRIVVNYDFADLVWLGARSVEGKDYSQKLKGVAEQMGFRVRKEIPPTSLEELSKMDVPNSEGFVIHFPAADLRLKIKFETYVKLHRVVTGLSEIAIWENLKDKGVSILGVVKDIPDELFKWIQSVEERLQTEYEQLFQKAFIIYLEAGKIETRKEQALYIQREAPPEVRGAVFKMLDKKKLEDFFWKIIRPKGRVTFKQDEI